MSRARCVYLSQTLCNNRSKTKSSNGLFFRGLFAMAAARSQAAVATMLRSGSKKSTLSENMAAL